VDDLWDGILPQVDSQISIGRGLVTSINSWYILDLSIPSPLVESSSVDLLTVFKGSSDVNEEVVSTRSSDCLLQFLSGGSEGCNRSSDNGGTGFC